MRSKGKDVRDRGLRYEQEGPVLIAHWGLSGPAVLKLSAWAARALYEAGYQAELTVNWLASLAPDTARSRLDAVKACNGRQTIVSHCPFSLPSRLWKRLVVAAGIEPGDRWADLPKVQLERLWQELTQGCFQVEGKGPFKEEFVTCGGVDLDTVNWKTMESRCCEGLYFAGEVLDIDGITGGFNFQSAWTTGWLAGQAMAG